MTAWTVGSYAEWAVPGYTEERQLGHGVSGRVVAAVSDATGERVAIKYLHKNLVSDPQFIGELRAEAEQLANLNAPHLAQVFGLVEEPREGAAIVMELIDGVSLREMLARGALSATAALVVLKDVLLALAAAHAQRLPHRDVKPDNVLVDAGGWCTLTDFGVAVQTDKQVGAAGTPEYMAPELWHGAPNVPATDIYAATAAFCESLTGKPLFSGRPGRLRAQHESTPVPVGQFDPPLQDLIGWGLAKDPEARPPSAMAFVSELDARASAAYGPDWEDQGRRELAEREAAVLPLHAGGEGAGSTRVTRLARRKVVLVLSVAAVALVAILGGGAAVLFRNTGHQVALASVNAASLDTSISVNPATAASKCARPTTFSFPGSITYLQTGRVSYQWLYSSGKPGPVQTVNFRQPGQLPVTPGKVSTSTAGDGWAQLKVLLQPGAMTSGKASYSLLCSATNSDISVTASIKPASLAYTSCSAPHPTLTVTGTIRSKNPGAVSFYWSMSNGEKTTPVQLFFTKAGSQPANPLTFPAWVPASGNVVLVVTKPAQATSKPAVYKVTCGPTATANPTTAASATATSASAKASVSPAVSKTPTKAPTTVAPTTKAPPTVPPTTKAPPTVPPTTVAPPTTTPPTTIAPSPPVSASP